MIRRLLTAVIVAAGLAACSASTTRDGTLAELEQLPADIDEVYLDDSLELAAQSYRRYLQETDASAMTPEAMRRLADLQIEKEYGVVGGNTAPVAMAAPEVSAEGKKIDAATAKSGAVVPDETDDAFELRTTQREELLAGSAAVDVQQLPGNNEPIPSGPREAIQTYKKILDTYPDYERNDQVLYQMSRAYDEIGQPDEAMAVMNVLVAKYPHSDYLDEVYFRRGEYYFVRKKYVDAENAYRAIIRMGESSSYYELALYKQGWAFYKQFLYEEALDTYMALLDYRLSIGYDFDRLEEENEEHRIADTFRVISLSFSNLGGPEVVNEYFNQNGHRRYADKIYGNLGEFYFAKLRYDDATSIYKSFISLNPYHRVSPRFSMRVVEIFGEAGFPKLVVESKKEFASNYAMDAEYWSHNDVEESPEVLGFLQTNLTDLANHYHALYRDDALVEERSATFAEAERWYRQLLQSFPAEVETPQINYQLADLLLENEDFAEAASEYEKTAYGYAGHDRAASAGYAAVYAHREDLKVASGARQLDVKQATVTSSLRFADTFPEHEQADVVLGAAADDLYEMEDFPGAIAAARALIDRYPGAEDPLRRSAWAVIAHSSMDLADYQQAEAAYGNVLDLTAEDDETRATVVDGLAAAVYKQGEQANLLEDFRAAANHFLRIKNVAPSSDIRSVAEYDAAAALMKLEDWTQASSVLEDFRVTHTQHELNTEATKQLAYIYRQDGQMERAAAEHERISAEATDPELARAALLTAAELYDEVNVIGDAIRVYERYVAEYPKPLDVAMETRSRLAEIFKSESDYDRYYDKLNEIVAVDRDAGAERTDRSRYLAAKASLVLAEQRYQQFVRLKLTQPFEQSLAEKQRSMDETMSALESLVDYEVADVTAAATFYIAEIYFDFSAALLDSERPDGLSEAEMIDYELVIEEEAFPFEERAIEVHEENFELLAGGIYNPWVQMSLDKLALLMPGRYAKNEISGGYVGSIDSYAYRMPIAPPLSIDGQDVVETEDAAETGDPVEATAQSASEGL